MEHPSEQVEHVEHTQHAARDPFDRRVAMTIAIVAALLAAVTMLGHKAHNETIINQIEAANGYAFYQAKNIRKHEYEAYVALMDSMAKDTLQDEPAKKARGKWTDQLKKYDTELPEMLEKANQYKEKAVAEHHKAARIDYGELGIELSLVLCSVAVLTKRAAFWLSGIGVGVVGLIVSLTAFLPHH